MTIVGIQLDVAWEDKAANFRRVNQWVEQTSVPPGSLVVLPEMFSTGFSLEVERTRQGNPPEAEEFLAHLARVTQSVVLGGVVGTSSGQPRNEAVAFSPAGSLLVRYAKKHPFNPGGEGTCYPAGQEVVTFDWGGFRIAPLICYDLRFPETFREAVDQGATLFAVIALWPARRAAHWTTLLQARAIENQAFVVGVNRVGVDPIGTYTGRSCVVNPHGIIVADAAESEGLVTATVHPDVVTQWRADFPALKDR